MTCWLAVSCTCSQTASPDIHITSGSPMLRLRCCLKSQRISELPNCKHVPRVGLEPAALRVQEKRLALDLSPREIRYFS